MLEFIQASKYTIKAIFKDNWSWFYAKHKNLIRDNVIAEVKKILSCKEIKELGYSTYLCETCGRKHIVANTCKSRFCNSCGKKMTDDWIAKAQKSFLNVPYHHIVFSPPEELWLFFRPLPGMLGFPLSGRRLSCRRVVPERGIWTGNRRGAPYFRLDSQLPSPHPYALNRRGDRPGQRVWFFRLAPMRLFSGESVESAV